MPRTLNTRTVLDTRQNEPFEWLKLAVGVGTLFIVAAYTAFAAYQLIEMRNATAAATRAANIADKTLRSGQKQFREEQRPWIGLDKFAVVGLRSGNPAIYFTFVNTGRTPAEDVKTSVDWRPAKGPLVQDEVCKDVNKRHFNASYIPPQGRFELREPTHDPRFANDATRNYWDKTFPADSPYACVFGEITYVDVSGTSYFTHFCVYANAPQESQSDPRPQSSDVGYCYDFNDLK